jgi:hypothetical protein
VLDILIKITGKLYWLLANYPANKTAFTIFKELHGSTYNASRV